MENNNNKKLVAYVDGSFSTDKNLFSYGVVLLRGETEERYSEALGDETIISMRNVAGEIKGAMFVIEYCVKNNIKEVDLHYDYDGIKKWCTGEWKAKKTGTIEYKYFYDKYSDMVMVNFIKVKAHSGDKYNEIADSLAKKAMESQQPDIVEAEKKEFDDKCYRELNLDRRKILSTVIDFFIDRGIELSDKLEEINVNSYTKRIVYNEENRGMIQYTCNDNGTTTLICKIGKMIDMNEEIAATIYESCIIDFSKSKSYSVKNVSLEEFKSILELIEESEICRTLEEKENRNPNAKCLYKIKGNNDNEISLFYYNNGTLMIQGRPLLMFYECMSIISELIDYDESNKAYNDYFEEDVRRESVESKYEEYMFNSFDKLPEHLRNGVKQSIYNTCIDNVDMFDFTFLVFPVLRALEGFIKYVLREEFKILIKRSVQSEGFAQSFTEISTGEFILNHKIEEKSEIKDHVCKMYGHYKVHRHTLFHMEDLLAEQIIESREIDSIIEARKLIFDTLKLIDIYYMIKGKQE